jgi:subtilisin family serine protease
LFRHRILTSSAVLAVLASAVVPVPAGAASRSGGAEGNYLVVYGDASQVQRGEVEARGGHVTADLSKAGVLAVRTSNPAALQALPGVTGVARDRVVSVPHEQVQVLNGKDQGGGNQSDGSGCASTTASCPLQWDLARINVPQAWQTTQGSRTVKVAVLDTGLTSGHQEVGANYDSAESKSFVEPNGICPADATTFASTQDFHGHGTWTGTHVAGVNGALMTGIAPKSTLVNIRVLGACGFGYDSWVMNGMLYGNQIGAQIESMSLGGFMCGHGVIQGSYYCDNAADVGQDPALWQAYKNLVKYMLDHGTLVVAASGNDHAQLDATGQVVSHGTLANATIGPDPANDYFGLTEAPGGVPGVVAVAALNRVTAAGTAGETLYGQYGVGRKDQLSYYSNYGERIDVSAPGGARNFNVPSFDCVTSNCRRAGTSSPTASDNPEDFGAWGVNGAGAPCNNCYAFVQGTSMATPQVAGTAALALAANNELSPRQLATLLRRSVSDFANPNATPVIETDPSKPTWNYSMDYDGRGISNRLLGRGVIDASRAVGGGGD